MESLKRYVVFLRWLIPDSLLRFKAFTFFVLVAGFLGVTFQVQAFGFAIFYGKHFSSGEPIALHRFGVDLILDPRTSLPLLFVVGGGILLSLLLSAVTIYGSRWGSLRLNRKYNEFCSWRVFDLLSGDVISRGRGEEFGLSDDKYFVRLAVSDSRLCGRVLKLLLEVQVPAITLCVAFVGLSYLEPGLTAVIMVCMLGFIFFQQHISRRVVDSSIQYEIYGPQASRLCSQFLQDIKQTPIGGHSDPERIGGLIFSGPMEKVLDAYEGRVRSVDDSRLISGVFMAAMLALIVLVMGRGIIEEGSGWGRLLVYLVAARVVMTSLQGVFGQLTAINRFYPQVNRYAQFVQSFESCSNQQRVLSDSYLVAANDGGLLNGNIDTLDVRPGACLALASSLKLSRYSVASLLENMFVMPEADTGIEFSSLRFVTKQPGSPNCSLRDLLGLSSDAEWEACGLPSDIVRRINACLPQGLDQIIYSSVWEQMDADLRFIVVLFSSLRSDCRWLFVEEKGLRLLCKNMLDVLVDGARDKILIIVYRGRLTKVGRYGESGVAVMDNGRIIGLGTPEWFTSVREQVEAILQNIEVQPGSGGSVEDELDDEC